MPSFEQEIENSEIIIIVDISRGPGQPTASHRALLDTGANITAISPRVITDLQLAPIRPIRLGGIHGSLIDTYQYLARVDIPIGHRVTGSDDPGRFLMGSTLSVAGLPYQPTNYDVILGMDFIQIFHITLFRNRIILSN